MHYLTVAFVIALAVCAFLVRRHARRIAPVMPTAAEQPTATNSAPIDLLQNGVKLDPRTDYRIDAEAKQRLMEKLRREEIRQKPQEGRN